jgi:plasmid stabilization system protein ParE
VTKVVFTKEATSNLIAQAQYIYSLTLDAQKADKFLLTMKANIIQNLEYFPKLGRSAEEYGKNMRKLVHQNYSIIYLLQEETISIVTIYRENLPNL